MKPRILSPDEREARLLEHLNRLMEGEISEGQLLRTLRRDVLGLTQEEYARLTGISRRTLSDLEGDKGNVSLAVMNRVFRPLGLKVGILPRQSELLDQLVRSRQPPGRHHTP